MGASLFEGLACKGRDEVWKTIHVLLRVGKIQRAAGSALNACVMVLMAGPLSDAVAILIFTVLISLNAR
jgi:hypothetical protein